MELFIELETTEIILFLEKKICTFMCNIPAKIWVEYVGAWFLLVSGLAKPIIQPFMGEKLLYGLQEKEIWS